MRGYKKVLGVLLAGAMVISTAGCSGGSTEPAKSSDTSAETEKAGKTTPEETAAAAESAAASEAAKKEGQSFKIGVEMKTLDGAFFTAMVDCFTEKCKERGWEVTVLNADSDTMKESENMDTFITQGYDLIFIDPYETEGCVEAINRAQAAGIPVICVDNSCADTANVVSIVYPDNIQNGWEVGKWVAENCFEKEETINSVCIGGQKGLEAARERRMGVIAGIIGGRLGCSQEEAIEKATAMEQEVIDKGSAKNEEANFNVNGIGWGNYTANGGLEAAEDLVIANKDMNFMFAENDAMLLGAMTAIENAGLTDQVILAGAADGQKEALKLIKDGSMYKATGNNMPANTVDAAIDIAVRILEENADPGSFDRVTLTNPACINPGNVDEYYDPDALF